MFSLEHILYHYINKGYRPAAFNNMRTLKFKAQPTNVFFATVVFGASSQLPTTAERTVIKSLRQRNRVGSCRKLGGAAEHLINAFCRLSFEYLESACY